MSLFPDQPPPPSPPAKPKLTPEERRARYTDRLTTIRLRMLIFRELDDARHHHARSDRRGPRHAGGRSDQAAARPSMA